FGEDHLLVLTVCAEDQVLATIVDLSDDPLGGEIVIEEAEHIDEVGAGVIDVAAVALLALQLADLTRIQELLRDDERRSVSPLMIERKLDVRGVRSLHHSFGAAPGICHRLLAVDGPYASLACVEHHWLVKMH